MSLNAAAKHIRKHHGEHVASLDEHVAAAGAALALAAAEGHDMRQLYLNAPQSTSGVDSQPLAPLAMLSVSNGFQCVWCDKCFKVLRNVREHGNVVHDGRGDELYKAMCQAGMIKVQTLLTGVKTRFFPVQDNSAGARVGTTLPPLGGSATRGAAAPGASIASRAVRTWKTTLCWGCVRMKCTV